MKTDKRIKAIVIAPVAIGFLLIVIGIASQNTNVLNAGIIVLFGGSGVAAFITVAYAFITAKRGNSDKADVTAENGSPDKKSDDGKERRSDTGKKVFSALFVLAFLGCLIGGMVLLSVGYIAVGASVFGCAFLIIVVAIIVSSARVRISNNRALETEKYTLRLAEVDSCEDRTAVSVTGAETECRYRVCMTIDGKQYSAQSRESYDRGDRLKVLLHENGEDVKIVEKASADDVEDIQSGKSSAVRAARKKLSDKVKEYRDKIEEELTHESEQLLELDYVVTEADIDELVDREMEIEMEFIESDETDEDFDKYVTKRRLLYDEMRRKIMKNPPLDDDLLFDEPDDKGESEAETSHIEPDDKDEPEAETSHVEPDGKDEPENDMPSIAEPTETPPIVPTEHTDHGTPSDAPDSGAKAPSDAADVDGEIEIHDTPSHAPTGSAHSTRPKRAAVGYKGIKKK